MLTTRRTVIAAIIVLLVLAGAYAFLPAGKSCRLPFVPASGRSFTICIQPFDDLPPARAAYVVSQLKKLYSNTVLLKPIKLPAGAWYPPRARYRADTIIAWLSRHTGEGSVTIGLTTKDISTTKDDHADWGVMGLGYCPGNACVVSTFRLSKRNLADQLFKVSIHELGHTQGLPHCEVKTCFMRDAEGHNTNDEEHEFCPKCRKVLVAKGWVFSN